MPDANGRFQGATHLQALGVPSRLRRKPGGLFAVYLGIPSG